MPSESQIRDAIDLVIARDLSDNAFGTAVAAQALVLAHRPAD